MALKSLDLGHSEDADGHMGLIVEMNITPLTDVFLVLLVIFMVTSSAMSQMGVDVHLPQATQANSQAQPKGVIISLMSGGKMRVNQQSIAAEDFRSMKKALKSAFAQTPSRLVILEGDRQAFLGSAIRVMDFAREAGAEKFAIATAMESPKSVQ